MHDFTAQVVANPKAAADAMVAAYTKARACAADTAVAMGVSLYTWLSWVERLGLDARLGAVAEKAKAEGWHHGRLGGRPPGPWKKKRKARAAT